MILKRTWISLAIGILVLALMKPLVINVEIISIFAVSFHVIFTIILIFRLNNKLKMIWLGAFLARIIFMLWDIYARHIFILPNSGGDSISYYNSAFSVSQDITLLGDQIYGGIYSKIIGLLFYIIGPQRIYGQYINVLLGLSVVLIIYKILMMLKIKPKIITIVTFIAAFFPNSLIMSAIFLREIFPTFFVTVSVYYFIKWYEKARYADMMLALLMLAFASMFHSGVIGIGVGYAFAFLFYKNERKAFRFTSRTLVAFILIIATASLILSLFGNLILYKFKAVEDISDIYRTANSSMGESAYLVNLEIKTPTQLLVYGPIKALYFLTAPLPMNWRGLMDIFTFFTDSMLYLAVLIYYCKNRNRLGHRKTLAICLLLMIISIALIFGIGVGNAGTAVRHRQKLISVFLILLAIMMDAKKKYQLHKKNKLLEGSK